MSATFSHFVCECHDSILRTSFSQRYLYAVQEFKSDLFLLLHKLACDLSSQFMFRNQSLLQPCLCPFGLHISSLDPLVLVFCRHRIDLSIEKFFPVRKHRSPGFEKLILEFNLRTRFPTCHKLEETSLFNIDEVFHRLPEFLHVHCVSIQNSSTLIRTQAESDFLTEDEFLFLLVFLRVSGWDLSRSGFLLLFCLFLLLLLLRFSHNN